MQFECRFLNKSLFSIFFNQLLVFCIPAYCTLLCSFPLFFYCNYASWREYSDLKTQISSRKAQKFPFANHHSSSTLVQPIVTLLSGNRSSYWFPRLHFFEASNSK